MTRHQAEIIAADARFDPAGADKNLYDAHRRVWAALRAETPPKDPRQVEILEILREGFGGYPENLKK